MKTKQRLTFNPEDGFIKKFLLKSSNMIVFRFEY